MTRARGARRPRFRLLPTVLLTLAILAVPTAVYAWGRSSSSFDIKTVKVGGAHLVPTKKALGLLRDAYVGANLFTVTSADVRKTLEPLAFVEAVRVDRDFPDTLAVRITEYAPAAYAVAGGRWYVVDEAGYVICTSSAAAQQLAKGSRPAKTGAASPAPTASASAAPAAGAPTPAASGAASTASAGGATATPPKSSVDTTAELVAGPPDATLPLPRIAVSGRVRPGATLTGAGTAETLRVITALPGSYRRRLAAVVVDHGGLTLRFDGGPVVKWGDTGRTLAKTVALRTVRAAYSHAGKTCTWIDVSLPDRTLAKPVLR